MARNNKGGGRKKVPSAINALRGNPGKRKPNAREPKPEIGMPDCPEHFTEAQRKVHEELGQLLLGVGVLTKLDGPALQMLATVHDRIVQCAQHIAKHGPVWINMAGCLDESGKVVALPETKENPHLKIQVEAMKRLHALLIEFGMTPSSRTKINASVPVGGDEAETDPLILLMNEAS